MDLLEKIISNEPITKFIITIISGLIVFLINKLLRFNATPKSANIFETIKKLKILEKNNPSIKLFIDEFKRIVFLEVHKLNLDHKKQKKIIRLYKKCKKKFTWNQIKTASIFFDYSKKKIQIKISVIEYLGVACFFLLVCTSFFLGLFALYALYFGDYNGFKALLLMTIGLIAILLAYYGLYKFIAPIFVAKKIGNHLKML